MKAKAYRSQTGAVWEFVAENEHRIFLTLDGHTHMHVDRAAFRDGWKEFKLVKLPFRRFYDLLNGKLGWFSEDSEMNKKAKRVS